MAAVLWIQLAAAAIIILVSASFMTRAADVIAEKTGLGRSFIGVVLLATATSLPELGTGISSIAWLDSPDLAAGDAFGSNLFNLLIIALLDLFWRDGPILRSGTSTSLLIAGLAMVAISVATVAIIIHDLTGAMDTWYISPMSAIVLLVFLAAMYLTYRHEHSADNQGSTEEQVLEHEGASLSKAVPVYVGSALVVIAAAVWLARAGDGIVDEMGWEASFVGTQFLALSTSLPELATSFAAIRLRAPELAIANVLGSNLFNMGLVLFLDDIVYVDGPFWAGISQIHAFTGVMALLMTSVVIIGLVIQSRRGPRGLGTPEAATLIGLFLVASVVVFKLG